MTSGSVHATPRGADRRAKRSCCELRCGRSSVGQRAAPFGIPTWSAVVAGGQGGVGLFADNYAAVVLRDKEFTGSKAQGARKPGRRATTWCEEGMRPKKSPASGKPDAGRKRQGPQALLHYSSVCAGASAGFSTSGAGVAAALGASALAAATASLVSSMMAMGAQSPARGRPSLTTRV